MKNALLALALCSGAAAAGAQVLSFDAAVQDYRAGRHTSAYGRFVELANAGHPHAAHIALFMHEYGGLLYRTPWDAGDWEVEDWTSLAQSRPAAFPAPAPELAAAAARRKADAKVKVALKPLRK